MARISLVGAGPGDPELLTLKGLKAIQQADVILYDDLVNTALLDWARPGSIRQYVGKRMGRISFSQEEINELIVDMACRHGHVVRLKGGDAFVFGRGHEEWMYAVSKGISCEVIPGVSSCIAAPASQGIPVTRRGVSESFWVIAGTTRHGTLSKDLHLAARSEATVVVMMGLNKLEELCSLYQSNGRGEIPVAVIQNGTRPDERYVTGIVDEIVQKVQENELESPAIIVVGKVVELHPEYLDQYALQNLTF